jgi:selenocysteine lyase/cysteine desulfurase
VQLPLGLLGRGDAAITGAFESALAAGKGRVKLAVVDHIASFPPVTFPVAAICAACRAAGARGALCMHAPELILKGLLLTKTIMPSGAVLVDGAHAVGARPLEVPELGAHYYTANLHKWACTPKGTALLWVERQEQPRVLPLATSHGYGLVGAWLAESVNRLLCCCASLV